LPLASVVGRVGQVPAHLRSRQSEPPQLDTVSALLDFANGVTGTLTTIRMTPLYWRVHVFGTEGSAEALDETTLVLRMSGAKPERREYQPINVVRAEIDAFVDTLEQRRPFPIAEREVLSTLGAFEAMLRSIEQNAPVMCDDA